MKLCLLCIIWWRGTYCFMCEFSVCIEEQLMSEFKTKRSVRSCRAVHLKRFKLCQHLRPAMHRRAVTAHSALPMALPLRSVTACPAAKRIASCAWVSPQSLNVPAPCLCPNPTSPLRQTNARFLWGLVCPSRRSTLSPQTRKYHGGNARFLSTSRRAFHARPASDRVSDSVGPPE